MKTSWKKGTKNLVPQKGFRSNPFCRFDGHRRTNGRGPIGPVLLGRRGVLRKNSTSATYWSGIEALKKRCVTEMYLFGLSYLLIFHYDHILPDVVIQ